MKNKLVENPEMAQTLELTTDFIEELKPGDKCSFMIEAELLNQHEGKSIWDMESKKENKRQVFLIKNIKKYKDETEEKKEK